MYCFICGQPKDENEFWMIFQWCDNCLVRIGTFLFMFGSGSRDYCIRRRQMELEIKMAPGG